MSCLASELGSRGVQLAGVLEPLGHQVPRSLPGPTLYHQPHLAHRASHTVLRNAEVVARVLRAGTENSQLAAGEDLRPCSWVWQEKMRGCWPGWGDPKAEGVGASAALWARCQTTGRVPVAE